MLGMSVEGRLKARTDKTNEYPPAAQAPYAPIDTRLDVRGRSVLGGKHAAVLRDLRTWGVSL